MTVQGFDKDYYLGVKLAALQKTSPEWVGKTTADLENTLSNLGLTPAMHYERYGYKEGLAPNQYFNEAEYKLAKATQMFNAGQALSIDAALADFNAKWTGNAYEHYVQYGFKENVNASNSFDESLYLDKKLAALKADPATATAWANKTVADLKTAFGAMTSLSHYLWYGKAEGLTATAVPDGEKVNVVVPTTSFTLTNGTDTASANVFTAGLVYTPNGNDRINALQDEDVLIGTGTNATLNATLGNFNDNGAGTITPTLTGIETINVAFTGSGAATNTLDLQDSTGVKSVNVTRISDPNNNVTIDNLTSVPTNLSLAKTNSPAGIVTFSFTDEGARGTADETTLTLSNVVLNQLLVQEKAGVPDQGIETIKLVSTGSENNIGTLFAEDLKTLTISGDKKLVLGTTASVIGAQGVEATRAVAGLGNVAGSLTVVDASALAADFEYTIGAEINAGVDNTSGVPVNLKITGGKGNDVFRLAAGASIDTGDEISGGESGNIMVHFGGASVINGTANIKGVNNLEVRTGHDAGVVADTVTINADAFDSLKSIYVRNEGMTQLVAPNWSSAAEGMTVTLNNLTAAQAADITVAHGTTGNSTVANNIVNAAFKTAAADNAAQVTLVDGVNADPVFNLQLNAASAEKVTILDNDTESNTVHLTDALRTQAGSTLTVLPGTASDKTMYMNFDSSPTGVALVNTVADVVNVNDYVARVGYGIATDGTTFSNTIHLDRESAEQVRLGAVATRDAAASSVFYGTAGVAGDGVTRHTFESVVAGTYEGDVIIRLNDITRADGVSSMNIATGAGNDTFIFDAIGLTSAGFTSGDTVAASTGTDTLVIDGNSATIPGTPRINHQTSEWDNLKGIDVLRFASNAGVANVGNAARVANAGGAYYAAIDNDFIAQTDAGNRLTVVNNDGDLTTNSESDLVLDLRGLSQSKWVTFIGANSNSVAGLSSNRLVLDDVSANQNMILNGGDTDVRNLAAANWARYTAGNNNVYEVRNTANVSINDLSQTRNFGLINFTNDQATPQTLTLTLNSTIVEQMVDSSRTATNAATQEILNIVATDQGAVASILNIDARTVTGFNALTVTGSLAGADILNLNANVGGSTNTVNLQASAGDRVNWTGGAAGLIATIDLGADANAGGTAAGNGYAQFVLGAVTTTHDIDNAEIADLTGLTYAAAAINGTAVAETFVVGRGIDTITTAAGADIIQINAVSTLAGTVYATADHVTDFATATDSIDLGGFALKSFTGAQITSAIGTDDVTVAPVALGAAAPANTTVLYTLASTANVFASQANIDTAVNDIITTVLPVGTFTAAQNTKAIISLVGSDGNDVALFYYNESDGIDGIAANELQLLGVLDGVGATQLAAANLA